MVCCGCGAGAGVFFFRRRKKRSAPSKAKPIKGPITAPAIQACDFLLDGLGAGDVLVAVGLLLVELGVVLDSLEPGIQNM